MFKSFHRADCPSSKLLFAQAQVIPGRWEKLDAQVPGTRLIVTTKTGERIEGIFKNSTADEINISDPAGAQLSIPKTDVTTISSRRKDSLWNGGLIGAAIPAAAIIAIASSWELEAGSGAPLLVGVGLLIGVLADRAHEDRELLYQAAKP